MTRWHRFKAKLLARLPLSAAWHLRLLGVDVIDRALFSMNDILFWFSDIHVTKFSRRAARDLIASIELDVDCDVMVRHDVAINTVDGVLLPAAFVKVVRRDLHSLARAYFWKP